MSPVKAVLVLSIPLAARTAQPPPEWDKFSAYEKVTWMNANLDIGRGGSDPSWRFDRQGLTCFNSECIYPGGQLDRSDIVAPYQCRMFNGHPDGLVGWFKAVFDPHAHNYTGIFKKNADYGFFRIGYQGYPPHVAEAVAYADWCKIEPCNASQAPDPASQQIPAMFMGLKFFRDHVPSGNIHMAATADRQGVPSWSLLSKLYTNMIKGVGVPENDTDMNPFMELSQQAAFRGTRWPGFNGLLDLAMYDQDGNLEHKANFPYELILVPSNKSNFALPHECIGNISATRERLNEVMGFGDVLWHVYVKDTHLANMTKIGIIELASPFMTSADIDRQGFFPHTRFERDIEVRPEFTSDEALGCKDYFHCFTCPQHPWMCNPTPAVVEWWRNYRETGQLFPTGDNSSRLLYSWAEQFLQQKSIQVGGESFEPIKHARASCLIQDMPELKITTPHKLNQFSSSEGRMLATDVASPAMGDVASPPSPPPLPRPFIVRQPDDVVIDPATGYGFQRWALCPEQRCDTCWPQKQRPWPFATPCKTARVRERETAEVEYRIDENCPPGRLPWCNKRDGTWYSMIYPCKCGTATCQQGQLCTAFSSSCVSWGPYANATGP